MNQRSCRQVRPVYPTRAKNALVVTKSARDLDERLAHAEDAIELRKASLHDGVEKRPSVAERTTFAWTAGIFTNGARTAPAVHP